MAEKKIAVLLANGFEEGEALFVIDVMRRAGFVCDGVSVDGEGGVVRGSHGIRAFADVELKDAEQSSYDAVVAAPQVLAKAGISAGRRLTSYPGEKYQKLFADADYVDDNRQTEECVVVDGNLITSRGPGTTLPFAYRLVEELGGDADKLRRAMQYDALKESLLK